MHFIFSTISVHLSIAASAYSLNDGSDFTLGNPLPTVDFSVVKLFMLSTGFMFRTFRNSGSPLFPCMM